MQKILCPECRQHICPSVIISHLRWTHRWSRIKARRFKWRVLLGE